MGAERVARQRNENVTSHRPPGVGAPPWVSRSQRARERAGRRGAPPVRVGSVGVVVGAPACCCAHSNRRAPRPPAGPVRQRTHGSVGRRKPPLPSAQRGRASKSKRRSKRVAGRGPVRGAALTLLHRTYTTRIHFLKDSSSRLLRCRSHARARAFNLIESSRQMGIPNNTISITSA
jgi:hypothetical protein